MLALGIQADGKILLGGVFVSVAGFNQRSLARLEANGSPDPTFLVPDGGIGFSNSLERVYALAVQPNGQILITGDFTRVGGVQRDYVARLNRDGSVDEGFDAGAFVLDRVEGLALQPDGKVLVGGTFESIDGVNRNGIARLLPDGALDLGFDPGSGATAQPSWLVYPNVATIQLQPNGQVLLSGEFTVFDGVPRQGIARLNPGSETNLTLLNFYPYGESLSVKENVTNAVITVNRIGDLSGTVTVQFGTQDGTAVAGQNYTAQSGTLTFNPGQRRRNLSIPILDNQEVNEDRQFKVALADPSGGARLGDLKSLVVTIRENDVAVEFVAANFSVHEMQRLAYITVHRVTTLPGVEQFTVDYATADGTAQAGRDYEATSGTLHISTWGQAPSIDYFAFAVPILDNTRFDGERTVLLSLRNPGIGVVFKGQSNAVLTIRDNDTLAGPGRGPNDAIQTSLPQSDHKLLVGGQFTFVDGVSRNGIARLNEDGTLDANFNPGAGADGPINALAQQPDERIIVSGSFTNCGGVERHRIARLNADGSLDPRFEPGSGWTGVLPGGERPQIALVVDAVGRIITSSRCTNYNGAYRPGLARLHADGSLDESFVPAVRVYENWAPAFQISALAALSDGHVLVGGFIGVQSAQPQFSLVRLNADGSLDTNFFTQSINGIFSGVRALAVQSDGKLVISSDSSTSGYSPLARLNVNGTEDISFHRDVFEGSVTALTLQPDGRILVTGQLWDHSRYRSLLRLHSDGGLDNAFAFIPLLGGPASVSVMSDGIVWLSGSFGNSATGRYYFERFSADGQPRADLRFLAPVRTSDGQVHLSMRGQLASNFVVQASSDLFHWENVATNPTPTSPLTLIDPKGAETPQRFYRAQSAP